jgi:hypothetical protein
MITTHWYGRLISRLALSLLAAGFVAISGAQAQSVRIFVASYGNDANDGSRGSPKRNFQAAHNAVAPGGQIVVLDTAGYGALAITKSLSVTVPPGVNGFVTVTGSSSGITINAAGTDIVNLRGLIVEGGTGFGIYATQVGALRIEDCVVRSFNNGIFVNSSTDMHLFVRGGSVRDIGLNGIIIEPSSANVTVEGTVTDCAVTGADGVAFYAFNQVSGGTAKMTVSRCTATRNNFGFGAFGAGSTIIADNCIVTDNTNKGVNVFSGGTTITRSNNTFSNNAVDGTFTSTLAPK